MDESLNWDVGARTVHKLGQKQPKQLRTYGGATRLDSGSGSEATANGSGDNSETHPASPTPTGESVPAALPLETDLDAPGPWAKKQTNSPVSQRAFVPSQKSLWICVT